MKVYINYNLDDEKSYRHYKSEEYAQETIRIIKKYQILTEDKRNDFFNEIQQCLPVIIKEIEGQRFTIKKLVQVLNTFLVDTDREISYKQQRFQKTERNRKVADYYRIILELNKRK